MNQAPSTLLTDEVEEVLKHRLAWILAPTVNVLQVSGRDELARIVTWAASNLREDLDAIVKRYTIEQRGL